MALSVKMNSPDRQTHAKCATNVCILHKLYLSICTYTYRGSELNKDSSIYISPTNYVHTYVYGLPFTAVFAASNGLV